MDVWLHRFFEADGIAREQQKAAEAGDLVEFLFAVITADFAPWISSVRRYVSPRLLMP